MITVVIPYYQRSEGILSKALKSIAAQRDCPLPIHVIVVDDASPVPAQSELDLLGKLLPSIQIIQQANAGPGAARNTGLDHAPPETQFIAFLDSDDEWTPLHLARAVAALNRGFDFYFADLIQLGATVGAFQRAGRLNLAQHPQIPGIAEGLHHYTGDLLDQTIRGNLIGTSTVVYRFERYSANRFRPEFKNAGEDYLFWMEVAVSGARVAFSCQCEVFYGWGVNIYAGSGWGTEQHLERLHNELKYRKLTGRLYSLNPEQKQHIARCLADLRLSMARDLLHRVSHRKAIPWQLLRRHFQLDPQSFFLLPLNVWRCLTGRRS